MALTIAPIPKRDTVPAGTDYLTVYAGDTISDRPASATTGSTFIDLATGACYTYTGSAWTQIELRGIASGFAVAASDQSVQDSAFHNDDTLKFDVVANGIYHFTIFALYDTTATADFKIRLEGPASPDSLRCLVVGWPAGSSTIAAANWTAYSTTASFAGTGTQNGFVRIDGVLDNGANAGTVTLTFGHNTNDPPNNLTRLAGSWVEYRRVA